MKHPFKILLLIITFWNCSSSEEKLFWISEPEGHRNDFIDMAESANVERIEVDKVRLLLNWKEIMETDYLSSKITDENEILPLPVQYKDYGEIYKTDKFKLHVIFRDGNNKIGRDYKFILRTYSSDWTIIDSYDLAIWNKESGSFCFGSISKKLTIEKRCENSESIEIMQINENGKITKTGYNKGYN